MVSHLKYLVFSVLILSGFQSQASVLQEKVGWLERATITGSNFPIEAKIDTGADNSSINAKDAELYTHEGRQWVRFSLLNKLGEKVQLDKPIVSTTHIKTKNGGLQKRSVIEMDICLGTLKKRARVNLVDRSHFKYQLLIGRSFLSPNYLVDTSQTHLAKSQCI